MSLKQREAEDDSNKPSKRNKNCPADDLKCPITLELLFDPVTAEDGRLCEHSAILAHFEMVGLKSPVTNETMGRRLLPAVQIKNHIEALIETGAITGDLADIWKEKEGEKKEVDDLKKRAEGGDSEAMRQVGILYCDGEMGVAKDTELAKKASDAGNVKGMEYAGAMLANGYGVEENVTLGTMLTAVAAERGSERACYSLGVAFARGMHGLPIDTAQSIRWLRKALSGDCQDTIAKARQMLQELESNTSS